METDLPPTPVAGRLARDAMGGWLSAIVGEAAAENVRLATSELVTNAVRHGHLQRSDIIVLSCLPTEDVIRVEVEQASSAAEARLVAVEERDLTAGGTGLRIVDRLASRWGVDPGPPGRVWCEFRPSPDGPASVGSPTDERIAPL